MNSKLQINSEDFQKYKNFFKLVAKVLIFSLAYIYIYYELINMFFGTLNKFRYLFLHQNFIVIFYGFLLVFLLILAILPLFWRKNQWILIVVLFLIIGIF